MSWSIILIKTPLNDETDLSKVDETLPITDKNAFMDWMQNTFLISDENLSDSVMVLQLDNECGVEISWDVNESIENIHLCFHGSENEETILRFVKQLCSYWDCRAIDVQTSEFLNIIPEKEYSTICISNHSYRNALVYDDEKQEIKELNILLSKL